MLRDRARSHWGSAAALERAATLLKLDRLALAPRYVLPALAVVLFAVSAWQANRDVCPGCAVSEVWLRERRGGVGLQSL